MKPAFALSLKVFPRSEQIIVSVEGEMTIAIPVKEIIDVRCLARNLVSVDSHDSPAT